jgi:hypothetical protein
VYDQAVFEPKRRFQMNRSSGSVRIAVNLSDSVRQRLNMYSLAAGAAGVSMLALVQPCEAKIVYTPAHRVILSKHAISVDLNHDGIGDFTISNHSFCSSDICGRTLLARPSGRNKVMGVKGIGGPFYASALKRGSRIGPKQPLSGRLMAASGTEYATVGYWLNVDGRYLGLKFFIKGHAHYGWARFNVTAGNGKIAATLTGYAYETIANKPIIAGQTHGRDEATLGHLATGAFAIPAWRAKPTTATTH